MSINALSSVAQSPSLQPVKVGGRDKDSDETTESTASKAKEAAAAPSVPVDTNRGRSLNAVA